MAIPRVHTGRGESAPAVRLSVLPMPSVTPDAQTGPMQWTITDSTGQRYVFSVYALADWRKLPEPERRGAIPDVSGRWYLTARDA